MTSKSPRNCSEKNLKKLILIAVLFVFCLFERAAHGQQIDAAFGFGTLTSAAGKTSNGVFYPSMGGGLGTPVSARISAYAPHGNRRRYFLEGESEFVRSLPALSSDFLRF